MKGKQWALQDAKNRLSEVVDCAVGDGPQTISRRGEDVVVVVSIAEYRQLTARKDDLVSFLRSSPLADIDLERSTDTGREIEL